MKRFALSLAALVFAVGSGPLMSPPVTGFSKLHTAAGDAAIVGTQRVVRPGEVLFGTTLVQPDLAMLSRRVASRVHGIDPQLSPLTPLRRATLSMPNRFGLTLSAMTYCAKSRPLSDDERRSGPAVVSVKGRSKGPVNFDAEASFCLIDETGDGSFERAFIMGARVRDVAHDVPITPIAYTRLQNLTVPNRYLRLEYAGTGSVFGPVIRYKSNIDGVDKEAALFVYDDKGALQLVDARKGIRGNTFPKVLDLGPVQITLLARDPETAAITYRVDRTFAYREVQINVSDGAYNTTYY